MLRGEALGQSLGPGLSLQVKRRARGLLAYFGVSFTYIDFSNIHIEWEHLQKILLANRKAICFAYIQVGYVCVKIDRCI